MIAPRPLAELIAASPLVSVKTAIATEFARLLPGVAVVVHPGKLDIADVVAGDVVRAPGIALGWTRIRTPHEAAGTFSSIVEWAAYIVAEDTAVANRRTEREAVAHAIGSFLLDILADPETSTWGLANVAPPARDPAPELRPVFTAKSYAAGTVYYAVTWSQALFGLGALAFDEFGDAPALDAQGSSAEFGGLPLEIAEALAAAEPDDAP
ncbi:hypothetical protein [Methylopila sp. M107]|uniref:hypothetical protein n=1 Tax=Methylopila sp. M107 TaxID=1101190 RepID=UPI00036F8F88|nr:hypothetical protein [Methylopila sp. M107]